MISFPVLSKVFLEGKSSPYNRMALLNTARVFQQCVINNKSVSNANYRGQLFITLQVGNEPATLSKILCLIVS